jgi:hypothetical protein
VPFPAAPVAHVLYEYLVEDVAMERVYLDEATALRECEARNAALREKGLYKEHSHYYAVATLELIQ